jgi:ornithine cyclodeaminase/alanine dehydrogenase-like protein (mu-crystallin family)
MAMTSVTPPSPGPDQHDLLVLGRADLESLGLTWPQIIDVLEDAFRQKAAGLVQNPPKPKVVPREGAFGNAMPAYLGGSDALGLKWVTGYPDNHAKGLPYIYGTVIVNDAGTGRPIALLDGGWVTEMRTPGVSGVTMRHVPGQVRRVALIGFGAQGRRHLEVALTEHPEVEEVVVYDHHPEAVEVARGLAPEATVSAAASPEECVDGADLVVTTISRALEPRIDCRNTAADALLLPVDYDDAIDAAAAREASLYAVDDLGQYGSVAGSKFFFDFPEPDTHLAAIVAGDAAAPTEGRRMVLNMGIAMDDIALATLLIERAGERGVGQRVAFP